MRGVGETNWDETQAGSVVEEVPSDREGGVVASRKPKRVEMFYTSNRNDDADGCQGGLWQILLERRSRWLNMRVLFPKHIPTVGGSQPAQRAP